MRDRGRLLLVIVSGLLLGFFAWEWYLSPEARVRRFLARAAKAAEEKDAARLRSCLSTEFSSDRGLDYASLADRVERGFTQVDRLNVTLENARVEVESDSATATFDLTVVAVRGQERYLLVGAPMQPEKLVTQLIREGGEWKILRVESASPPS